MTIRPLWPDECECWHCHHGVKPPVGIDHAPEIASQNLGRKRKRVLALLLLLLPLAACREDQEFNDAGKIANLDSDALVISMPDGFSNVAAKCVGTDLLYSAMNANGRAIAVSPGHPWCEDEILDRGEMSR